MNTLTEADVEQACLDRLESLGWRIAHGPDISRNGPFSERASYEEVVLAQRLRGALDRLNPALPPEALDDAFRKLTRPEGATLEVRNRHFHRLLVDGVTVEYRADDGGIRGGQARALDFDKAANNDWLAVNQFSVVEQGKRRRADVVLFVNGLPLGLIELKNPGDPNATIWSAWRQLQTYKAELPTLFAMNAVLMASDGLEARVGTLTAGREWVKAWDSLPGRAAKAERKPGLQTLLEGLCEPASWLSLLRDFIVFEDDGGALSKKMAGYHQVHAVEMALGETLRAAGLRETKPGQRSGGAAGDGRIDVVWHTQGSGKSLTMAFYAGRIIRELAMSNPTVVVLTDRNDLDDQLFATFSRCQDLLRQPPVQAASRADLQAKLAVEAGGVVFTTIQKFLPEYKGAQYPCLSERSNIVVIADEAHRSQYEFVKGFARHMRDALPNASFIGFTGTPIESQDANTRAVFGDMISVYDIQRSVADKATVPIYYESRLAKLDLIEAERPKIDPDFEEATEGEELDRKEELKTKWAQLEALAGAEKRLKQVAQDIVTHYETRLEALEGKAMIVCMSRRICVDLYRELVRLKPAWQRDGQINIVMTGGASDPPDWQEHIHSKARRERLAKRFRDPADPFRIVLVRDMWLTGFDAPSLHTMYLDKPMRGHVLMQAIARVNRVFRDKPGGLIVDYLGLAPELKRALAMYSDSGGTGKTVLNQDEAVAVMREKYEICCALFHGFDWSRWTPSLSWDEQMGIAKAASDHILALQDRKDRFRRSVRELSQAFALSVPHEETLRIRDDLAFFQYVQVALAKLKNGRAKPQDDLDFAIRQIISRAIAPEGVVDIFAAAGLNKPDVSILSEDFLAEVRGMPHRNLAVELLQRLLKGELANRRRKNLVEARSFAEMLEKTLLRYQNRAIEAAQVIEELIQLAREMREADSRGEELDLTDEELAFYDALETNDSAVKVLGDEALRDIARELVNAIRKHVTIDWTMRETVRANLRRLVKRILRRHGYPPDKQEKATLTVLEQAETLSEGWAMA